MSSESFKNGLQEKTPFNLEPIEMPESFRTIFKRVSVEDKKNYPRIEGFEDILHEPLGAGELFFNAWGCVDQLVFILSVAQNPSVNEIINNHELVNPRDIIKKLREGRVLAGLKVIDLGCGIPTFAIAARTLGADVYTADFEPLPPPTKTMLNGHTALDLNRQDASEILKQETRGDFDVVTENIIDVVPTSPSLLKRPKLETIMTIGNALLKERGFLFLPEKGRHLLFQKRS